MEWVKTFYARQNELGGGFYAEDVGHMHRQRIDQLEHLAGVDVKQILELGAGGGQTAAAAVERGHTVVAVEIMLDGVENCRRLAAKYPDGALTVVDMDFYTAEFDTKFDVVCYWDGFGIGEDDDQRRLLARIANWLKPGGCALLDIGTPWHAAKSVGHGWRVGNGMRRYGFDADGCRWTDTWWPLDDESDTVTQSLRCYSPADLRLLLSGTGLQLSQVVPGGAMDYEKMVYTEKVELAQATQYIAKLEKSE
ncbi:class I SAM-dependent methyltransferase [Chloroflexi bacterium TSY]|nr:class I SAM-dependent methyltransferase [Chloroflexi bacterium TSY]